MKRAKEIAPRLAISARILSAAVFKNGIACSVVRD